MSTETESISRNYQSGGWKAHYILIVCSLLYMINYMDRTVITVVVQPMKLEMGLTDMQLGSIQMAYMLSHGILAFPVAYIIDRWSRKKSVGITALLWSIFAALTGLARDFAGLLVSRTFVGISGTAWATGGVSMLTAAYPRHKHGIVMGIFHAAIPLGIAAGAVFGGIIAAKFGWRSPFFFLAGFSVILGISAFFMQDYKTIAIGTSGRLKGFGHSVIKLLKIPTMRWFLPGYGLLLFTIQAQISWLPAYLMRQFNWATDQAGNITGVVGLMAIVGAPLGGTLADTWYKKDRRSRLWLPAISALLSSLLLAVCFLTFSLNFVTGLIFGLLFGILNMTAIPVLSSVSQDVVPAAHKSLSYGLTVFCMYFLGGAWSPMIVGATSDWLGGGADGLKWAVILACAGGLLSCICFIMGARYYARDEDEVKSSVFKAEK